MATYTSIGRTNYFAVRDTDTLRDILADSGIDLETDAAGRVVLIDGAGTDWMICRDDSEDGFYLPNVIADYLAPGEVAVFQSVGNERLRYLGGNSVAVNDQGDQVVVRLDDIYAAAAKAFNVPLNAIGLAEY